MLLHVRDSVLTKFRGLVNKNYKIDTLRPNNGESQYKEATGKK